jgi:hypothetical protein
MVYVFELAYLEGVAEERMPTASRGVTSRLSMSPPGG